MPFSVSSAETLQSVGGVVVVEGGGGVSCESRLVFQLQFLSRPLGGSENNRLGFFLSVNAEDPLQNSAPPEAGGCVCASAASSPPVSRSSSLLLPPHPSVPPHPDHVCEPGAGRLLHAGLSFSGCLSATGTARRSRRSRRPLLFVCNLNASSGKQPVHSVCMCFPLDSGCPNQKFDQSASKPPRTSFACPLWS